MKKGKYYEKKTADVIQKFNPTAQVMQGVYVEGKLSKISREVDVQLVDPTTYDHIMFECKDHKAKVDIELVEALASKLKDVGAQKAAIVSNSGFTKGAFNIAQAHGIDLLTIVDTSDDKIRTKVYAPNIIEDTYVESGDFRISATGSSFRLNPNLHQTQIKTPDGVMTWPELLAKHWNEDEIKTDPEVGQHLLTLEKPTIIDLEGKEVVVDKIEITYNVKKRFLMRNLELLETQGIYDVAQNTYKTSSIKTERVRVEDLDNPKLWTVIDEAQAKSMHVPFRTIIATPLPTKEELEAQ